MLLGGGRHSQVAQAVVEAAGVVHPGCRVEPRAELGEVVGVLGVVGPTRMAYDRSISSVRYVARLAAGNRIEGIRIEGSV